MSLTVYIRVSSKNGLYKNRINSRINAEGLLKVTGTRLRCESGNISETVQDVILLLQTIRIELIYSLSDSAISDDFE